MNIEESNYAQGAVLSQLFIIGILAVGALFMRQKAWFGTWYRGVDTHQAIAWWVLTLSVSTFALLIFSDAISAGWGSLFKDLGYTGIPWRTALRICFLADILWVTWIVFHTGGSVDSPFQPIWFLVPTLALFLRESTLWVVAYSIVAMASFVFLAYGEAYGQRERISGKAKLALCVVSALCLTVTTFIGIYTR